MSWPKVRIGDVCEVKAGRDYKDVESPDGKYPIYGTGGVMGMSREWRCPAGSVIVGRKGTLDNPMLINEPFWNIDTCFGVVPSDKLLPAYLWRFCQNFDFYSLVPASGRPSTTSDAVKAIKLPLPPLAEQKKIVEKVEKALKRVDALKAQFERMEKSAADYFKAALAETFAAVKGEKVRLGEVCECKKGPFGSALVKRLFVPRGAHTIKVYEQKNAIRKNAKIGDYYITEEYFNSAMRGFEVVPGDIIVSCAGTIGETYVLPKDCERGIINQALMRIRLHDKVLTPFFLYYFDLLIGIVNGASKGTAIRNIPPFKIFKALPILIPLCKEQEQIVEKIDAAKAKSERMVAAARRCIGICGKMRKAILAEAFQ